MGKNIDKTFIQSKMLNKSKGPAVHSLRAQADKTGIQYRDAKNSGKSRKILTIKQGEVTEIIVEDGKITGVKLYSGAIYHCQGSCTLYRNLSESKMHLRRCQQSIQAQMVCRQPII